MANEKEIRPEFGRPPFWMVFFATTTGGVAGLQNTTHA